MKKYYLLSFLFLLSMLMPAQTKFGNTTKEELEMTSYENDTTAAAVVLKKSGYLRFQVSSQGNFQYEYTEEKKVKILKAEALEPGSSSNVVDNVINYYAISRTRQEDIKNLSATTYNLENGEIVKTKLSKENIFDEDVEGKWKRRKFTIPAAKVGSVIEYKYTITSDFIYDLKDFYYQESIPVMEVEFEAIIPEYLNYNLNNQGYVRMDVAKREPTTENFYIRLDGGARRGVSGALDCNATKYIFKASNVTAAKKETFLWTINDYISKTSFELRSTNFPGQMVKTYTTDWETIDKELLSDAIFGGNLKRSGWFKDEISNGETTIERASEILELIKSRVQWNKSNSLYSSKLKKALEEGVGSSADMNFLLINALTAAGFDAFPVIMSTRNKGRIPITHPSTSALNYLITGIRIGDNDYFTDASSKFSTWNLLPEKCMVDQARMIYKGRGRWVDLSKLSHATTFKQGLLKFEDGKSIFKVTETYGGNAAYNKRNDYSNYDSEEKFIQKIEENENCRVLDFKLTGYENKGERLIFETTKAKDADLSDFLYITPPITKLYTENPFKTETREFPINFNHITTYVQMIEIEIPEGYEVAEMPRSEQLMLNENAISYLYRIVQSGNKLVLNTRFQVKTLLMLPTDYQYIKDFFAKMINKNNEQIVLKKIEAVADQTSEI